MKNVTETNLKRVICVKKNAAVNAVKCMLGEDADILFDLYGVTAFMANKALPNAELIKALSSYYDVEVESVHTDNSDYPRVWITYTKEENHVQSND